MLDVHGIVGLGTSGKCPMICIMFPYAGKTDIARMNWGNFVAGDLEFQCTEEFKIAHQSAFYSSSQ